MERDEVYRRAMRAALAVTGGRLARVSLGLCIAGSGLGCIEDPQFDPAGQLDAAVTDGQDSVRGPDLQPNVEHADQQPEAQGDAAMALPPGEDESSDQGLEMSANEADMGLTDPEPIDDHSDGDDHPDDDQPEDNERPEGPDDPHADDDSCLAEDAALTDWRCCDGHGWDRSVPGCTPCDQRIEPSEWTECVTCEGMNRNESPEQLEEYMACCDAVQFDFEMGCLAWGPPAPPEFDGRTLDEILGQ